MPGSIPWARDDEESVRTVLARLDSNQDQLIQRLAVHIGARVAALAAPSEVMVSQTVKDLVAGSGLTFEDSGEHELKGVPDRWHLYRVVSGRA
jgi:class 3 adenylate cyclase